MNNASCIYNTLNTINMLSHKYIFTPLTVTLFIVLYIKQTQIEKKQSSKSVLMGIHTWTGHPLDTQGYFATTQSLLKLCGGGVAHKI